MEGMMVTIGTILFPTDFSEPSEAAWGYALTLAKEFGANIVLLHVVPEPPRLAEAYEMGFTPERFIRAASEEAQRLMADMMAKAADMKVAITPKVRQGAEFREIIDAAREACADIIVMGTHGRTGLAHALIGSVAEKVVRKAPCPVLTVRHPKMIFEMP
jgi:nucleotide-binding universal stress UspA family protein